MYTSLPSTLQTSFCVVDIMVLHIIYKCNLPTHSSCIFPYNPFVSLWSLPFSDIIQSHPEKYLAAINFNNYHHCFHEDVSNLCVLHAFRFFFFFAFVQTGKALNILQLYNIHMFFWFLTRHFHHPWSSQSTHCWPTDVREQSCHRNLHDGSYEPQCNIV